MGGRDPSLDAPAELIGPFAFDERRPPSANVILRLGPEPVLIDCGADSAASRRRLVAFLAEHELAPGDLRLLVTTHFHVDHVGNAAWLQREHGVPVAAHAAEAALIEAGDPRAFDGPWLGHAAEPYRIDRRLADGDRIGALEVVGTPSQTPGHLALHDAQAGVMVTGDLLQADDVAWVRWEARALERTIAAIHRLAGLGTRAGLPGHGPPVRDVPAAVARTLERYESWRARPELAIRHAIPRALVANLATRPASEAELLPLPWLADAAAALGEDPGTLLAGLVAGLAARGVLRRRGDGRLEAAIALER